MASSNWVDLFNRSAHSVGHFAGSAGHCMLVFVAYAEAEAEEGPVVGVKGVPEQKKSQKNHGGSFRNEQPDLP